MEILGQNKTQKFYCKKCDYTCFKKKHWLQHIKTIKHNANKMLINANSKKDTKICCKYCNKKYKHISSLSRHQKICKKAPSQLVKISQKLAKISHSTLICECGKTYKHASSLSKHRKQCLYLQSLEEEIEIEEDIVPTNNVEQLLKNILKENKELKEQMKKMQINNTYTTNNNTTHNNQKFSINVFLNEKCKNAMSLNDFVDNIQLSLKDLEFTNKHGFVEGVSNIFIKNLNDMDVTERPIHCSDQKRLQFYVKKDDKWEKDKKNEEIDKSIEKIGNKQIKKISDWTAANPGYETNPKKLNEYYSLVRKIMGVNFEKNLRKVKKIIGENVKLEKEDKIE